MRLLLKLLNDLKGSTAVEILAGEPLGSYINLIFETKLNKKLTLAIYCSWRLESKTKIITGSNESNKVPDGFLVLGINKLLNRKVKEFTVSEFLDLKLEMNNGLVLRAFCDRTSNEDRTENLDNWVFSNVEKNISYRITNFNRVKKSKYD